MKEDKVEIIKAGELISVTYAQCTKLAEQYANSMGFTLSKPLFHEIFFSSTIYKEVIALVAMWEGDVVGWIQGSQMGLPINELAIGVSSLYVDPKFRNKNIGKLLISRFIDESRDIGTHTIVADSFNEADIIGFESLFRGSGFVKQGTSWVKRIC